MNVDSLKNILSNPNQNDIVIFILGILFILSLYHFILYFQHKDKSYLYYSLYTFLIFFNHLNEPTDGFISELVKPIIGFLNYFDAPLMWFYNLIYFIFGFSFLNLKKYSKKWYSFIFRTVNSLLFLIFIVTALAVITGNTKFIYYTNILIVPFFALFGIMCYYPLFTIKMPLKYYIIIGAMVLFISSLTAFYLHDLKIISPTSEANYSIFYIGIIIENIFFSLGLGAKQKLILQDKNESQEKLIFQLKENEKLRNTVQHQLEENVANLSKQAENEKLEKLNEKYNKEIAELKVSSLRSQMNPHFIFNSLNAIKLYIINNEKENAVYYLNKFSKLIRKILASTREKEISLAEEIETMELYVNIENIRFGNEIDFSITTDSNLNLDTIKIPSLILQPFIENAIWHGLSSKKGNKKLSLIIEKKKRTHIEMTITDNGVGREKSAIINAKKMREKESVGIQLTEERLTNFAKDYQNKYSIKFNDLYNENEPCGTSVTLKIPVM